MPLNIPTKNLAEWCKELVDACYVSQKTRQQRGSIFRNLYLTGDENGEPQIYKKTYEFIQNKAATLYSPIDLRFKIAPYGASGPRERAMGHAGSVTLLEYIRQGNVDTTTEDCVEWSLVKGKTFLQLEWTKRGFEPYLVQPETMGVLREDITSLDKQDAFVHSVWLTEQRFADLVAGREDANKLIGEAQKYMSAAGDEDRPETWSTSRQVMIGGQLYPYKPQGTGTANQGRGLTNWMSAPSPDLAPKTLAKLIRIDELWVWDRNRDDWDSFQLTGNVMIDGALQRSNRFADESRVKADMKKRGVPADENNPLSGHHPFVEICANPLADYFWGWSELLNVGSIQVSINDRVTGINRILRHQEDPSTILSGLQGSANSIRDKLRKPGGFHVESGGLQVRKETVGPEAVPNLWESLHELEDMFDKMGGSPPITQGRGESGVRSQAHSETLVRMARTLDKKRALRIERQIEEIGGLAKDLLRARCADLLPYWVKEEHVGPFKGKELDPLLFEPPAPKMVALGFTMFQLGERYKVSVDSHSASPAFSHEARELAFALARAGAMSPEDLVRETHPPSEEEIVADIETAEAAKSALIQSLPPEERVKLLAHSGGRRR